ncbi:MAG: glutamate--tRNA ligase [Deltaproteobacteria bacterium RBG_13_47_9]|nr:MAG: glutamate--tRNA ligase [Deltaproteobacteria bacterium RBG_13_47_9]
MIKIRTRFAPSPTGDLHIGGARTALFNWLLARHYRGTFILRIEDTDVARSTPEAIQVILDAMAWLGLDWDEGPFYQTQRGHLYQEAVESLLKEGKAYRCYCTPEELEEKRKRALNGGIKPKYDRTCLNRKSFPPDRPFAIRFLSPDEGKTVVEDLIQGQVEFDNVELDDLIIVRSDGFPTYNFSVVVDDVTMGITHVIRGNDHLNNTPRQIQIYKALDCPLPKFGHVPMILGPDKKKLSKRHGAQSVMEYQTMGYLPQAVVNYLVRLGWSFGDQEEFDQEELIEKFSLEAVGKSAAAINPGKLDWLNAQHIKRIEVDALIERVRPFIEAKGYTINDSELLRKAVRSFRERVKTLVEMADLSEFYFCKEITYDEKAAEQFLKTETLPMLRQIVISLSEESALDKESGHRMVLQLAETRGETLVKIAQPIRVALTGKTASPPIDEVMEILGKEEVIKRIERAIQYISKGNNQ